MLVFSYHEVPAHFVCREHTIKQEKGRVFDISHIPWLIFFGFLAIEWSQQLLFFQRLEERSSFGAIGRKILLWGNRKKDR
jgi:hypothetical protein